MDNNRKGFTHCNNCKQKLERGEIREETNYGNCEKNGFSPVWEKTISMVGQPPFSRKRAQDQVDKALTPEERHRKLYYSIIDNLTGHLKGRFFSLESLQFFELLNPRKCKTFAQIKYFPEPLLAELQKIYPNIFDLQGLKNELSVFYKTATFQE